MQLVKKSVILFLMLIFLTLIVTAQPPQTQIGTGELCEIAYPLFNYVQQDASFNLSIKVFDTFQGLELDDTDVTCYIHITQPDGVHTIDNAELVRVDDDFEIFLNSTIFSMAGINGFLLQCNGTVTDFAPQPNVQYEGGCWANGVFDITPTGREFHISESILYFILLIGLAVVFSFLFYWMLRLKFGNFFDYETGELLGKNDWKYLKMFLIPVNYVILTWIFGLCRSLAANYLNLPGIELFFNWAYWLMMYFAVPLLIVALWFLFLMIINDKKINESLKRGSPLNGP